MSILGYFATKRLSITECLSSFSKFVITSKDVHARWKRIVLGRHKTPLFSVPHQTSQFTTHIPLLTVLFCAKVALISSHKYISVKLEDVICKAGLAAGFFFLFQLYSLVHYVPQLPHPFGGSAFVACGSLLDSFSSPVPLFNFFLLAVHLMILYQLLSN